MSPLRLLGPLERRGQVRGCLWAIWRIAHRRPSQRRGRGTEMMSSFAGQTAAAVSAITLLVDFLLGITCGMFCGVAFGSVYENHRMSLLEQAPDPISAGTRVILGLFTRDDGYLRGLPPGRLTGDSRATAPQGRRGRR